VAAARATRADGREAWLLRQLGDGFTALVGHDPAVEAALRGVAVDGFALDVLAVAPAPAGSALVDRDGDVARRYDLQPGSVVLLRPDAHVCARWRRPTRAQVEAALRRALAVPEEAAPCP
jgi:3-(3-hydroxy-phenyl)propionate hydroxylase